MVEELKTISSDMLKDVSAKKVNSLIEKMVDASKKNMDEMCELTLECTTLLAAAENRSTALSNQGVFKRLIGNVTGKNQKLRDSILNNNTNALYMAQGIINRVMLECTYNRELMLAVNDRVSDIYLELKENQTEQAADILMVRKAIVAFYTQYKTGLSEHEERLSKVENYAKERCPQCQKEILFWQRVCPYCGSIHSLKMENMSDETKEILKKLSDIIKDDTLSEDIVWDTSVKKRERALRKVKSLSEIGKIPGFTDEIVHDIDNLISKCRSEEFQIAIVGVMKAGKSFLMNALMGVEIASVDVNPETAALTKFRSADGFYIKVQFHNEQEWNELKSSALKSKNAGENSLKHMMETPEMERLEREWVNHRDLYISCKNVTELRRQIKKYTSSQKSEHLFVSEVEAGIDKAIFNMPREVVFVDTPGLKDPVKYRSDITRAYIKKANAVLIAVPTSPLTAEGNEIITTVLDCTDTNKAYIVATQKDLRDSEEDCERIVSLWVKQLVKAKRYTNRSAKSRIILTSAKMDLLLRKWLGLSEDQRDKDKYFSANEYSALESYAKRVLDKRDYRIENLPYDEKNCSLLKNSAGIETLRKKLEDTLISKYRNWKSEDIEKEYQRCASRIKEISDSALKKQEQLIEFAENDAKELRKQIDIAKTEKRSVEEENAKINGAAEQLEKKIQRTIAYLERNGK